MDSQLFYFLNALFAGAFLVWFLAGRKGSSKPTSLNLKVGTAAPPDAKKPTPVHNYPVKYTPRERDVTGTGPRYGPVGVVGAPPKVTSKGVQTKSQQSADQLKRAHFVYNSHDWNAYEIFGLKPGATLPEVTEKYQAMIKKSDPGSLEFLETAYKTILKLT
jgi:hypothetical protein